MSRKKFSKEIKFKAIIEYVSGGLSFYKLAQKYGSDSKSIQKWYDNYQMFGEEAFEGTHHSPNYSADLRAKSTSIHPIIRFLLGQKNNCLRMICP